MKIKDMEEKEFGQLIEAAFLSALQRAGMAPTPPAIDLTGNETDVQPQAVPEVKAEGGAPTERQLGDMAKSCVKKHGREIIGTIQEFLVDTFGEDVERISHLTTDEQRERTAKFLQTLHHRGV